MSCDDDDSDEGEEEQVMDAAAAVDAASRHHSSLVDALLLVQPAASSDLTTTSRPTHRPLHVPFIVSVCCQHLQTHGQFTPTMSDHLALVTSFNSFTTTIRYIVELRSPLYHSFSHSARSLLYPPSERSQTGGYAVLLAFPSVCAHSYLDANISKTV